MHALGAVAYVLLTGRLVRGDGIASLLDPQLPPAPSTVADVPRRLDAPVLKAVDPARRWPDVASFADALEAGLPESVRGRLAPTVLLGRARAGRDVRRGVPRRQPGSVGGAQGNLTRSDANRLDWALPARIG